MKEHSNSVLAYLRNVCDQCLQDTYDDEESVEVRNRKVYFLVSFYCSAASYDSCCRDLQHLEMVAMLQILTKTSIFLLFLIAAMAVITAIITIA